MVTRLHRITTVYCLLQWDSQAAVGLLTSVCWVVVTSKVVRMRTASTITFRLQLMMDLVSVLQRTTPSRMLKQFSVEHFQTVTWPTHRMKKVLQACSSEQQSLRVVCGMNSTQIQISRFSLTHVIHQLQLLDLRIL